MTTPKIEPKDISLKGLEDICNCWKRNNPKLYNQEKHHEDCNISKVRQHIADLLNGILEGIEEEIRELCEIYHHTPKSFPLCDSCNRILEKAKEIVYEVAGVKKENGKV